MGYAERPVERQKPILELLDEVWRKNPDWRMGQLVFNALAEGGATGLVFNGEDDVLHAGLERLAAA